MLASLTADGEVEWLTTSDVSTTPSWDHAEVKRVDLDHTSDGKMLLSYQTNGQQTWGDLMLPLPDTPTSTSHRDHFMVMFDADGNALWYQHGNVTDGEFDVQSMLMDDGTVAVVRETARDGRAGAYLDRGDQFDRRTPHHERSRWDRGLQHHGAGRTSGSPLPLPGIGRCPVERCAHHGGGHAEWIPLWRPARLQVHQR